MLLHLQQRTDTLVLCLGAQKNLAGPENILLTKDRHHLTLLGGRNIFWPGAENDELTKDRHNLTLI